MTEAAVDREALLGEILAQLRESEEHDEPAKGGEDRFYEVKQELLDRYEPGSPHCLAVASVSWDEIAARLGSAG